MGAQKSFLIARHTPCWLCGVAIFLAGMGSGRMARATAVADDAPLHLRTAVQQRIAEKITALASDHWATRRKAERKLLSTPGFILPQLAAAMVKATNPEQRNRLLRICLQLYLRQFNWLHHGTSFIGIEFIAQDLELRHHGKPEWIPAVAVVRTVAGFPGGLDLRENDLIIGINGHSLPAFDTAAAFRAQIQQFQPGTTITLLLIRNGKLINVKVQLNGVPPDRLAAQELLNQRNLLAEHLIDRYFWAQKMVLMAPRQ